MPLSQTVTSVKSYYQIKFLADFPIVHNYNVNLLKNYQVAHLVPWCHGCHGIKELVVLVIHQNSDVCFLGHPTEHSSAPFPKHYHFQGSVFAALHVGTKSSKVILAILYAGPRTV